MSGDRVSRMSRPALAPALSLSLSLCLAAGLAAGCSDKSAPQSGKAVSSLTDTRDELSMARGQVDQALAAMNALPGASDLKAAFKTYEKEVRETEAQAKRVGE